VEAVHRQRDDGGRAVGDGGHEAVVAKPGRERAPAHRHGVEGDAVRARGAAQGAVAVDDEEGELAPERHVVHGAPQPVLAVGDDRRRADAASDDDLLGAVLEGLGRPVGEHLGHDDGRERRDHGEGEGEPPAHAQPSPHRRSIVERRRLVAFCEHTLTKRSRTAASGVTMLGAMSQPPRIAAGAEAAAGLRDLIDAPPSVTPLLPALEDALEAEILRSRDPRGRFP
jgi:hypothetical protein